MLNNPWFARIVAFGFIFWLSWLMWQEIFVRRFYE